MIEFADVKQARLAYRADRVGHPKAVIIVNHGFAEHMGRYDHIVALLNEAEFTVYRYDVRGHGRTESRRGAIRSYQQFIDDCASIVAMAHNDYPQLPLYMMGHSMGGMISVMYALKFPDVLSGQILIGPALGDMPQISGMMKPLLSVLGSAVPALNIKNQVGDTICSLPEVVEAYQEDPWVLQKATAGFYKEFLISAPEYIAAHRNHYELPLLVLHGSADTIVPPEISRSFFNSIASKDKQYTCYEGLYHEILNEAIYPQIVGDIVDWLNLHVKKR